MKAEMTQEVPAPIEEAEYRTLEQTLMESDRGRRFLTEFLNRNKTPETTEILGAIQRLEKVVTHERKVPNLDKIRLDIADMHEAIERTKAEIANIKAEGEESNRFVNASHELDAIVTQTEGATQSILEAAEQIQEKAWILRENGADDGVCDDIDAKATEIFMACSFQDLTGQRTNKVVQVLRYLESRINLMINIWGIEDAEADKNAGPVDTRPDAHLLNGPQRAGKGVSQTNVDELMSASDEIFDAALKETGAEDMAAAPSGGDADAVDIDAIMAGAVDEEASALMDADAIDDMFQSAPQDETGHAPVADDLDAADIDAFGGDPDAVLDEAAIEKLFDNEVEAQATSAAAEAEADADWKLEEAAAEEDGADPLADLTEAERQALFN